MAKAMGTDPRVYGRNRHQLSLDPVFYHPGGYVVKQKEELTSPHSEDGLAARSDGGGRRSVEVIRIEEKGSDVILGLNS